jgi:hypothetical protein
MRNGLLFVIVFFFCIYFIVWDISPKPFTNIPLFIVYFFLMPLPVAYIGIFISYLILVKGYDNLKSFFYDSPLLAIHKAIDGHPRIKTEIVLAYVFSFFVNFFIVYFIASTPLSEVIIRIPGLETASFKNLDSTVFDFQYLSHLGTDVVMFPFMAFGSITLFIFKFIRRREHNQRENQYPGARSILGFCYAVLAILIVNGIIDLRTYNAMTFSVSPIVQNVAQSAFLTFMGILIPPVMIFVDRLLIRK